ncbi:MULTISPECIES: DUF6325 family protein [unclassified Diaminobutyricimonas]|uniref:DUF6325 family protein n=1 Tax=unclassified Diaminobutyricimonas TaxID=2643261 RepID=UPI0012F4C61D|nr:MULTISPECIES: DUF6325 family protein [unclassified Diaminobutyricimonas]
MQSTDVHGPIDFVLIEFPLDQKRTGKTAAALLDLIQRKVIWVYDLMIIAKDADGSVAGMEWEEDSSEGLEGFAQLAAVRSGMLSDEDIEEAAAAMNPNTAAALIVYENLWAIPFVAAAREVGGEMIASARIPAQDIMTLLDAIESESTV